MNLKVSVDNMHNFLKLAHIKTYFFLILKSFKQVLFNSSYRINMLLPSETLLLMLNQSHFYINLRIIITLTNNKQ